MSAQKLIPQLYNQGDFIDAKDNQGDWRVGFIIEKHIPAQLFKVRFDGWSCKYDEAYKFNSPKLKHFRTYVIGYTGQMKNPGLRESWNFSLQNLQQRSNQMRNFMNNPLQSTNHQINQLIRGQNYLFTDFLMTHKYPDLVAFSKVIQYFWMNIELLYTFLLKINENFDQFLKVIEMRKQPQQNSSLQAYYLSFYELFDTLFTIFGNYERLEGFFKTNEQNIRQFFKVPPNKDHKKFFKKQLTKRFLNIKGNNLIQQTLQKLSKIQGFVPFLFLSAFGHLIVGLVSILFANYRENLLEKLFRIGKQNVKKINENQIKELHRKEVSTFIEALTTFSGGTKYEDTIEEQGTYLQLDLSLKMILCPYFQRKLKGISHITEVCEKHQSFIYKDNKFRLWIDENHLFKNLFILNDNPEIIKKSCELTRFLVIRKMLKHEDFDIIWNSRIGKHETVLKEIYTLLSQLPYYQKDHNQNVRLFNKISNVPAELWDDEYIHMIRVFSTYSYGEMAKQDLKEILGFQIISQYTVRQASDLAINELGQLFFYIQDNPFFAKFQEGCLLQIKNRNNAKKFIRILYKLGNDEIVSFSKLQIEAISILQQFLVQNANSQDNAMVEQALKLLQLFVKATSSYIEASILTNLWSKFIDSQNRIAFLNWIYITDAKYKGLAPIFRKSRLAQLLLKILWKTQDKKRNADLLQISIVIQLIKEANVDSQKVKYATISNTILPNEMHGHQLLMNMLQLVADNKAAHKICEFLAFIYVNIHDSLIQKAIFSLSQTILKGINQSLRTNNNMFLQRLLIVMKKTLDYDEQLYPSRPNLKHHYTKEFIVIHKDNKQQIAVKFSYLGNFYEFKKILSTKLNIPMHKFYLLNGKGIKLGKQHFNKSMVDQSFTGSKFQLVLKEQNSIIKAIFNENIDTLFNLLDDPSIQILLWSIIERLPLSQDLKAKIAKSQNIFEELQHLGFYKQLYMLKVMQELDSQEWLRFAKGQKINKLIKYLAKIMFVNQIEEQYVLAVTNSIMKMVVTIKSAAELAIPHQLLPALISVLAALFESIENGCSKSLQLEEKIIKNVFQIANYLSKTQNVLEKIMSHDKILFILNSALILIPRHQIRNRFVQEFKILIKSFDFEKDQKLISLLLGNLFISAIHQKNKENLKEYYNLTSFVLSKCSITVIEFVYKNHVNGLVSKIFDLLKKQKPEQSNQNQNKALEGYLTLLKHLIKVQKEQIQAQVLQYIVYECLFNENNSKCKSSPSRRQSFSVLLQLSENAKNLNMVVDYLVSMHKRGKWRSRRFEDWGITFTDKMKSSTGYVGLKNLGCICYMNSFIQQLFMVPYFRYSIANAVQKSQNPIKPEENVLYQLQKMFMNLQYSDKKFYSPKQFCYAFKDYEGNQTNVTQQMDIDQFSNILFDRLQNLLKPTQYPTLIKDMFGGVFSNQIVCKGCPHYSESQEPFLSISLTVKSKKTIFQGFQSMIKGDNLDGDNAYYCQRCNKKVNAVKRMSLKKLPNYLIITLKRFQFDYQKMMKLKVNDFCQFPHNLNLREYSRQFLRKQQASKTIEQEQQFDNQYFNYVLKGFVIHVGHADSGHYYSIIQDRSTGKWYQYNDAIVRDFDIEEMPEQAFGGEIGMTDMREKIKNAYMVIYQRQEKIALGNEIYWKKQQIKNKPENHQMVSEIMRDNKEHKLQNILFSKQYTLYLINMLNRSERLDYNVQKSLLKFATIYYLTVKVREKAEGANQFIMKKISKNIQKHRDLALWILNLFSIEKIYDQFFQNNPYKQMKKMLSYWLVYLSGLCQPEAVRQFLHSCLNKIVAKGENAYEICIILYQILNRDKKLLQYAISVNVIGKLMQNISKQKKDKKLLPEGEKESEIGYQTVINSGLAEQLRQKKLRMIQNENQFVWGIVNLAIRYSAESGKELKAIITESQWQNLFIGEAKVYKIIEELRNKFFVYEFTYFLAYLTKNNEGFLGIIVEQIFTGLRDFQSKRYRQFMLLFQQIINIRDDLADQDQNYKLQTTRYSCFEKIVQALKHNQQYSLDSNIIQQWLVILLNRNQNLRAYLQRQSQTLDYLLTLATKKVPQDQISRKNKKYADYMVNKLHGVMFLCSKKAYIKQSQHIKEFYQSIAENKFVQSHLWPTAPDNYLKKISANDKVAYFDQTDKCEYDEVFVSNIFLGKIELSEGKSRMFNVWKDDERLMAEVPPIHEVQASSQESSQKLTEQLSQGEIQIIDD